MAHCILLVLPPYPLTDCAKAALKAIVGLLQKAIVCPTGLEAARKVHALDLSELETANESPQSDAILEDCENPLAGKVGTTAPPARGLQLDRIWLILGCWLLSGLVIDPLFRSGLCMNNPGLVTCYSVGLCLLVLVVIQGRKEGRRYRCCISLFRFTTGNQKVPNGPRLDSHISRDRLFKTSQPILAHIRQSGGRNMK